MTHSFRTGPVALRVLVVTIMALALGGPSPGHIGACNGGGSEPANWMDFCTSYETWSCTRDLRAGRIDSATYSACAARISTVCSGSTFPVCRNGSPGTLTQAGADLCIGLIRDAANDAIPTSTFVQCNYCAAQGGI